MFAVISYALILFDFRLFLDICYRTQPSHKEEKLRKILNKKIEAKTNLLIISRLEFQQENSAIILVAPVITSTIHAHQEQQTALEQNTVLYQRTSLAVTTSMCTFIILFFFYLFS